MNIFLDIETIPTQRDDVRTDIILNTTHPANISKADTIAKWEREKKPDAVEQNYRKTALSGNFGEIICIGYAVDDLPTECLWRDLGEPETNIIELFYHNLYDLWDATQRREKVWIGHNITGFDLRFIWQRARVNGVKQPFKIPYDAKPWSSFVFDTMIEWGGLQNKISQDNLCKVFNLPLKPDDIDGSKVWDHVKDGKIKEVVEYCKGDVETVRKLYRLMS